MKYFFIVSVIALLALGFIKYEHTISYTPPEVKRDMAPKDFKTIIFSGGSEPGEPRLYFTNFLPWIKNELNFTGVHVYRSDKDKNYGEFGVRLNDNQTGNINSMLTKVSDNNLKLLFGTINVENMCYTQRLVYEAEGGNYGFSYQKRLGGNSNIIQDEGRTVLFANHNSSSEGMLCENIYENMQHGDLFDFVQEDSGNWYIKPSLKIKSGLPDTTRIVRVDVINFKGDKIKSFIIKAKDFGAGYDGKSYVENFGSDFVVSGNPDESTSLNYGVKNYQWYEWDKNCNVDFKIWWYGEADVWIDKVTVDDNRGNKLFKGDYDDVIKQEAELFADNPANMAFFADELVYSNIECVKKVKEILNAAQPGAKMHIATTNFLNVHGMKNDTLGYRALFNNFKPESFSNDAHEIPWELPEVFANKNITLPAASYKTNEDYNSILQKRFGQKTNSDREYPHGPLVYQIELARSHRDLYSPSTQFIMQPQLQGWLSYNGISKTDGVREPTNEEIQAQAMLAISHGAGGICWFILQSFGGDSKPANGVMQFFGGYGLVNSDAENFSRRTKNLYGEDKWSYVSEMNQKILKWKPTLDKINFNGGYSVHSEGANYEYINDIKSFYRNSSMQYTNEDAVKYWEIGFFNSTDVNDKAKYFMMVNRRCVPETSVGTGDLRKLKIKFNPGELTGYNNWKVLEVNTNAVVQTISVNSSSYFDFGIFQPGEGKLYKLEPVN